MSAPINPLVRDSLTGECTLQFSSQTGSLSKAGINFRGFPGVAKPNRREKKSVNHDNWYWLKASQMLRLGSLVIHSEYAGLLTLAVFSAIHTVILKP